jgi:hypothetical protein
MVDRSANTIHFSDGLNYEMIDLGIAKIYEAIYKKSYEDIILDFSKCVLVFPFEMLRLCSYVLYEKSLNEKFDFVLNLPNKEELARLFNNSNWSYLLDPLHHTKSSFRGFRQLPAEQYHNDIELNALLNKILDLILSSFEELQRSDLAAIEWSLSEIMDNVLVHSESKIGGIVQMHSQHGSNKKVEIFVADAGIGIPESLKIKYPNEIDSLILLNAVKEGVTLNSAKYLDWKELTGHC